MKHLEGLSAFVENSDSRVFTLQQQARRIMQDVDSKAQFEFVKPDGEPEPTIDSVNVLQFRLLHSEGTKPILVSATLKSWERLKDFEVDTHTLDYELPSSSTLISSTTIDQTGMRNTLVRNSNVEFDITFPNMPRSLRSDPIETLKINPSDIEDHTLFEYEPLTIILLGFRIKDMDSETIYGTIDMQPNQPEVVGHL